MRLMLQGSTGASVQLLQLALNRAGYGPLAVDGRFGPGTREALRRFQTDTGLRPDGIAGPATHRALCPWYTGTRLHRVQPGDTLYALARRYGSGVPAILTANPGLRPENLRPGETIRIPLPFPVVPADAAVSSELVRLCLKGLVLRYPFLRPGEIGRSALDRPLQSLCLGTGENRVFYSAAHHANEWITTLVLLRFVEELAAAYASGGQIAGTDASEIFSYATVCLVPLVNPDGVDLVTGDLEGTPALEQAREIAAGYPQFPFPEGWKANIRGVDLNLQYPAGWEEAKAIKASQGILSPAPANYVGAAPLSAPEARAVADFTRRFDPALILAYHSQGEVIYWKYRDREPASSRQIAELFARLSGYAAEETPYAAGFAGYKDWFIQDYDRPGYTVEVGLGLNPLPLSQLASIYARNEGILTLGALVT